MKKKHGGSLLLAWRRELDQRGLGWVTYKCFTTACSRFGLGHMSKALWEQLCSNREHLQFSDLSKEDAANLENFLECLNSCLGLNFQEVWSFIDVQRQNWITIEEFTKFSAKMEFQGDARSIFHGLESHTPGRIYPDDLAYLKQFLVKTNQHTDVVLLFTGWVRRNFCSNDEFIAAVGQGRSDWEFSIKDFAAHLTSLVYNGDALRAARKLSMLNGGIRQWGNQVSHDTVRAALEQAQPTHLTQGKERATGARAESKPASKPQAKSKTGTRAAHEQQWDNHMDDMSAKNEKKAGNARMLFSPCGRLTSSRAASAPRAQQGPASTVRTSHIVKRNKRDQSPPARRPEWNNALFLDDLNKKLPAHTRSYFSEKEKPMLESLRAKKKQTQVVLWAPGPTRLSRATSEQWFSDLGYKDVEHTEVLNTIL
jgi:hypothetical protein